ncbi:unnamed protein product [Rotaria sp. Silwood1]|nr:unnamed protein product [Rotaria sp. Silwood1]
MNFHQDYVFHRVSLFDCGICIVGERCGNNFTVLGEPDFVFYHNKIAKLVGEVKIIWSFPAPDNLAAAYYREGNTLRLPVQQIFGYMRINHLKYGILTNYENFYFMKRENNLLHISTAIKSSDVDISVYRALYYIVYLSIENYTCSPNTSKNDNKNYDSDDDELEEDREEENDEDDDDDEDEDDNIDYPKRQKKQQQSLNRKKQKSSRSKKLKLTNEVVGYGRNGHVYKSFYDNKVCVTKICDIIKNKEMITRLKYENQLYVHLKSLQGIIIPNRITSGYLKNLNWFYIVCYEFSGKPKTFDEYTYDEKQMTLHALRQLHLNNVLHNDLRWENFLVNYDDNNDKHNRIMLCDLETAVILNENDMKKKNLFRKEENKLKKLYSTTSNRSLSHIERIIKEKANLFIKETPKRHRPPSWTEETLDVIIRWLLRQCGRIETESRRKCIELVCTFIPLLPANQPCLTDINEQFSLPIAYQWLDTVIASLDCYTWVFSQGFLNPLLFQDNNQQSHLITSVSYFISKISMNTLRDIVSYFPISNQSYVFTPNDVLIVRLLNFITAIWSKYPFDIRRAIDNSFYSNDWKKWEKSPAKSGNGARCA